MRWLLDRLWNLVEAIEDRWFWYRFDRRHNRELDRG